MAFPDKTYIADTVWGKFCLAEGDGVCRDVGGGVRWDSFINDKVIEKYVQKDWVCIDGGANYLTISLPLAPLVSRIYAFEAQEFIYKCGLKTIELNNIKNIESYNYALFSKSCNMRLNQGPQSGITYGIDQASSYWVVQDDGGDIQARAIDDFNFEKLDFLKLDIQGDEIYAIQGAIKTINKCRPIIVYETDNHPIYGNNKVGIENILKSWNYRIEELTVNDFLALPIEKY